ncbi:hypothetical protein MKX03_027665 [Papaver bracteatum]|nr:hypothetical protein MKX03_027665 [Papaver bracteatum]
MMEQLDGDDGMYGSATKPIQALSAKKWEFMNSVRRFCPSLLSHPLFSVGPSPRGGWGTSNVVPQVVIDLDSEDEIHDSGPVSHERTETPGGQIGLNTPGCNNAMVIGSQLRTSYHAENRQTRNSTTRSDSQGIAPVGAHMSTPYDFQSDYLKKPVGEKPAKHVNGSDQGKRNVEKEDKGICGETVVEKSKGVYVGIQDDTMSNSGSAGAEDDGFDDMWMEMKLASEMDVSSALSAATEHIAEENECEHSFVLVDDLGYVCRICSLIEKSREQIFDFQWGKGTKTSRTSYMSQSRTTKDCERVEGSQFTIANASDQDFGVDEISVHPRHMKQMKPHQMEGFKFLLRNLVCDSPGGCILAHAPGSGKTFMIISFMQSFLAKYPNARPLVVLPKGILETWKREFKIWQVEEIPLDVLKQWVEHKGILFLGYQQFASIVSNRTSSEAAADCRDILLKVPTLLILDEGHTPRNETTDMLDSLSQVQTPRKVVLSGTLFQNHVKEVFNILNLVGPRFLKLDMSDAVVRRVKSRVQIPIRKKIKSGGGDTMFYDLVEETLQNDQDFRRKDMVIQDLRELTGKVLHYYKGDFLDELPGLVDLTVLLTLNPKQNHAVENLSNLDKFKRRSMESAAYVHPQLNELSESCAAGEKGHIKEAKIDELLNKVELTHGVKTKFFLNLLVLCESVGEKLLVFSQYLLPLKFLERLVVKTRGWSPGKEIFVITGDSSQYQREISMERFNNSKDAKVFFGSIKACGEGISLVGASRLLILDIHLNPSVTRQAIGRAFRPGQTKKVYAYRLVAADSPEVEDHHTSFRKEVMSKMWFEWNEICGHRDFEMVEVDTKDLDDSFWDRPSLGEDVKALYKRSVNLCVYHVSLLKTSNLDFSYLAYLHHSIFNLQKI